MEQSVCFLQRYFDLSLIPADTGDERLGHYQAAATDLGKRFEQSANEAADASRVAVDPNCPASDPWFETVQEAVKLHWKTFLLRHHDPPRQICRGILLEALRMATAKQWDVTNSVWYSASNIIPFVGTGPEQDLVRQFVSDLGREVETQTSSEWRSPDTIEIEIEDLEIRLSTKATQLDEAELAKGFSDAAGPHNQKSENFGNPNNVWTNDVPQWSYNFAPRAAKAVAVAVNKALAGNLPSLKSFNEQASAAFKKQAGLTKQWLIKMNRRSQQLGELMWWRQTLYSPALKSSYRSLSHVELAVAGSFDLAQICGDAAPISVEYLLREMIRGISPDNPRLTLRVLYDEVKGSERTSSCLPKTRDLSARRMSLIHLLASNLPTISEGDMFRDLCGAPSNTDLHLSEWAVWMFREHIASLNGDQGTSEPA